jgi:Asp-tRNA(Asn)/Glu-tRNA(Gln) amidotransferase A subunit family amidase
MRPRRRAPSCRRSRLRQGRLRIAFTTDPCSAAASTPDCIAAVNDAAKLLASLGHDVVEDTPVIDRESFNRAFLTVVCCETAAELYEAATVLRRPVKRSDVRGSHWALALIGRPYQAPNTPGPCATCSAWSRRIGEFFERYNVHVSPVVAGPPFPHGALQPPGGEKNAHVDTRRPPCFVGAEGVRRPGARRRHGLRVDVVQPRSPNATGQPAMSCRFRGIPTGFRSACTSRVVMRTRRRCFGGGGTRSSRRRGGKRRHPDERAPSHGPRESA